MSFEDLEKSIENLKDIEEAPRLRERNRQLYERLHDRVRQHERERQEWFVEKKALISSTEKMRKENKELKDLRLVYDKDFYSLKEIDVIVNRKFDRKLKQ